ncbi:MAG: DNA-binding protein WhiA [Gordonia polyisoprenivorans]|nr:DNA-binding protein WhiA [Gordonia polyisoprenivorans]
MTVSDRVKDELAVQPAPIAAVRAAQLGGAIRLAGTLHTVAGRHVLDLDVDRDSVARRLSADVAHLYGYRPVITTGRAPFPVVVRVDTGAVALARQTGLVDRHGRAVRGLASQFVRSSRAEAAALWRGAFMVRGELSSPRRALATLVCPTPEAALALSGVARRIGVSVKAPPGNVDGPGRLTIRGADDVAALLEVLGARTSLHMWDEQRHALPAVGPACTTGFATANESRAVRSAAVTAARLGRAFEILDDTAVSADLAAAGRLRLAHPGISLDALGRLADPPATKDTIAGRLRRLLVTADTAARTGGIPDTYSAVPVELVE